MSSVRLDRLIQGLKNTDWRMRVSSATSIAKIGARAKRAVPALCRTLKDQENVNVRSASAWALGNIGKAARRRASLALIESLRDNDWTVRAQSAEALGMLQYCADSVVTGLTERLIDAHATVREASAIALGRFGKRATRAVPTLCATLNTDNSRRLKIACLRVLEGILLFRAKCPPQATVPSN